MVVPPQGYLKEVREICIKIIFLIAGLTFSSDCVALIVTGGGLGVGYPYTNVARKTANHPIDEVAQAIIQASKKMDIRIIDNTESNDGRKIKASAGKLAIVIDLEKITTKTTLIVITATKGIIQKDKATALEIINQAELILTG